MAEVLRLIVTDQRHVQAVDALEVVVACDDGSTGITNDARNEGIERPDRFPGAVEFPVDSRGFRGSVDRQLYRFDPIEVGAGFLEAVGATGSNRADERLV